MTGPPPRPTPAQRAELARLAALGVPAGLAADAAFGRLRVADVEKWLTEYRAALAAERAKWGGFGLKGGG